MLFKEQSEQSILICSSLPPLKRKIPWFQLWQTFFDSTTDLDPNVGGWLHWPCGGEHQKNFVPVMFQVSNAQYHPFM